MIDKNKSDHQDDALNEKDALVDALESIKGLLAKSDSKLSAARESLATASSSHSQFNSLNKNKTNNQSVQTEIPVLDDIVNPPENAISDDAAALAPEVEYELSELESEIEEIPTLYSTLESPSPGLILNYLDNLQEKLEQTLSDSLKSSIVSIEAQLKASLASEIDIIREQIKKDFS